MGNEHRRRPGSLLPNPAGSGWSSPLRTVMNVALAVGLLTVCHGEVSEGIGATCSHHRPRDARFARPPKPAFRMATASSSWAPRRNPTWEDVGMKEVESAYQPMFVTIERNGKAVRNHGDATMGERSGLGFAGWDERGEVQLGEITPNLPAQKAGLKKGDLLIAVNGQPIHSLFKFQEITQNSGGKPVEIDFERNHEKRHISVRPVFASIDGPERWMIGVMPQQKLNLITTPAIAARRLSRIAAAERERRDDDRAVSEGPGGAAHVSEEPDGADRDCATLRGSGAGRPLGIRDPDVDGQPQPGHFHLLPIPILDGGVILMLFVEMVMQRDLSLNVKEAVFKVGFVAIMVIVAFAIYNDISRILPAG